MIKLPEQKFDIIYADPPWTYKQQGPTARGAGANHYNTMSLNELKEMPVRDISTDRAICFMWATFPLIREAIELMEAWGFEYKTVAFTWVKTNKGNGDIFMGMGAYTRANAEVVLLGISKNTRPKSMVVRRNIKQIVISPRRAHSQKPPEIRDKIVELLGDIPRIELFAREVAEGWYAWGDEIPEGE